MTEPVFLIRNCMVLRHPQNLVPSIEHCCCGSMCKPTEPEAKDAIFNEYYSEQEAEKAGWFKDPNGWLCPACTNKIKHL